MEYLWLDLLAAGLIAVLSGMGVGSGGLLVIYQTLDRDAPPLTAQGVNLLFYLFSAGASLFVHATRRQLQGKLILTLAGAGLVGAWFGAALARQLDPTLLRRLFGGMLVASGTIVLLRKDKKQAQT